MPGARAPVPPAAPRQGPRRNLLRTPARHGRRRPGGSAVPSRKVNSHVMVGDPPRRRPLAHAMNVVPVRVGTGTQKEPNRPAFVPRTEHRPPQRRIAMTVHGIDRRTRGQQHFDSSGHLRLSAKCSGVQPSASAAPESSPSAKSALRPSTSPPPAAECTAVRPDRSRSAIPAILTRLDERDRGTPGGRRCHVPSASPPGAAEPRAPVPVRRRGRPPACPVGRSVGRSVGRPVGQSASRPVGQGRSTPRPAPPGAPSPSGRPGPR